MRKFDLILTNPPYKKNLHLEILNVILKNLSDDTGSIINISPVPLITSIRNVWSELAQKKFNKETLFKHLVYCAKFNDGEAIRIFGVNMQQHMGITIYDSKIHNEEVLPETYAETFNIPNSLIIKIMKKCQANCIRNNHGTGNFMLPISEIHSHIGNPDFLNIMCWTYEDQLNSKGRFKVYFNSESDRHDFYDFWMSNLGKFITMLWKVDLHVMDNFIPYFWCKDTNTFKNYFNLTDNEMNLISNFKV